MASRELPNLSDVDRDSILTTAYGEAGGASDEFKKMVLQTILNRYASGRTKEFGDSFQEIVGKENAYYAVRDQNEPYMKAVRGDFDTVDDKSSWANMNTLFDSIVGDKDYGGGEMFYFTPDEEAKIRVKNAENVAAGKSKKFNFDAVRPIKMVDGYNVYAY